MVDLIPDSLFFVLLVLDTANSSLKLWSWVKARFHTTKEIDVCNHIAVTDI